MGGRRLPFAEALRLAALTALGAAAALAGGACLFGGGDDGKDDEPTMAAAQDTATATPSPTPSPTPDFLATPPASQVDARAWLQKALGPTAFDPPCPERLKAAGIACAQGDANGDGATDLAYLVPVKLPESQLPYPAAVFVRDGKSQKFNEFALDLTADASILGVGFFGFADRTGDGDDDLSYLQNTCGSSGCRTVAVVQSWDGTAWRDAGPGDGGVNNVDAVRWEGTGAASELTVHGGKLPASAPTDAGPTRASTTTYTFHSSRYLVDEVEPDAPEYLYHAFLDAEREFKTNRAASRSAYEAIIADKDLKDWKAKPGDVDRRPALKGFAMFRLVLIEAAAQADSAIVTAALDRVILESAEPLFVNVAQEFRRGYNEQGGVIGGCGSVNVYLSRPVAGTDTPGYVKSLLSYGYANPSGDSWLTEICPF
jgi:hypothetical protein